MTDPMEQEPQTPDNPSNATSLAPGLVEETEVEETEVEENVSETEEL